MLYLMPQSTARMRGLSPAPKTRTVLVETWQLQERWLLDISTLTGSKVNQCVCRKRYLSHKVCRIGICEGRGRSVRNGDTPKHGSCLANDLSAHTQRCKQQMAVR